MRKGLPRRDVLGPQQFVAQAKLGTVSVSIPTLLSRPAIVVVLVGVEGKVEHTYEADGGGLSCEPSSHRVQLEPKPQGMGDLEDG